MLTEYVLLLALFTLFILNALVGGPQRSFNAAAPMLGARIENHLVTGETFMRASKTYPDGNKWANQ
jgi:hypothetical protein